MKTAEARIRLLSVKNCDLIDATNRIMRVIDVSSSQNLSFYAEAPLTHTRQLGRLQEFANDRNSYLCLIERISDGALIGSAGLHEYDKRNANARLGAMLFSPSFRGQGYATEAMRMLIEHGFTVWQLQKVYFNVFVENVRTQKRYGALGFKKDGVLRQHYFLPGDNGTGTWHDMIHMSLLKSEWEEMQAGKERGGEE